jgi:hypothetical protein
MFRKERICWVDKEMIEGILSIGLIACVFYVGKKLIFKKKGYKSL